MGQDRLAKFRHDHIAFFEGAFQGQGEELTSFVDRVVEAFHQGRKLVICGSGGLGPIANFIVNLFLHRLAVDRPLLPTISLNENLTLTASLLREERGKELFSRLFRTTAAEGDVLLALADGHRDPGLVEVLTAAQQQGCSTALLLPGEEEPLSHTPDFLFRMTSDSIARTAEGALFFGHLLCQLVEGELFGL